MARGGLYIALTFIFVLALALYLTFIFDQRCDNLACWDTKLTACSKAVYVNDAKEVTWQYTIKGEGNFNGERRCVVEVEVLNIKEGPTKNLELEGKTMLCGLPLGTISNPETNPELCTGELKERMQTLIIQQLYQYILDNVGDIGDEIGNTDIFSGNTINEANDVNSS